MTSTESAISVVSADTMSCVHHWVLGDPADGRIPANCKRCGATKGFPSNPEGTERFDDYRELTQSSTYYGGRQAA
jgi:hypothetical protein